jgi:hypothetical protein
MVLLEGLGQLKNRIISPRIEPTTFRPQPTTLQRTTHRYITEIRTLHNQRCENFKSYIMIHDHYSPIWQYVDERGTCIFAGNIRAFAWVYLQAI